MGTLTSRYGMYKIDSTVDTVNVITDFNNNLDIIDLRLGTQVCTSSTRPSSPVQGQLCFETDTGYTRKYNGTSWTTVGNANATSGSLPANPVQADLVYINDLGAIAYYSGGAWHSATLIVCTSGTRPTGGAVQTGSFIYETDTLRMLVWNGSSWVNKAFINYVCTSGSHPASPFAGLEIYETDTGMSAVYSGSNYSYNWSQVAPTQSVSAAATISFSGLPPVRRLMLVWRLRSSTSGTALTLQVDGDSTATHYVTTKFGWHGGSLAGTAPTVGSSIEIGTVAGNSTANYFGSGNAFLNGWNATNGFLTTISSSGAWDTSSAYWREEQQGIFSGSTVAHTSFVLTPTSGTLTGEVSVYGSM